MENTLPTWNGLIVDEEWQQFRCYDEDGHLECCSFNSVEGAFLYAAYKGTIRLELAEGPGGLTYMVPRAVEPGEEGGVDIVPSA